MRTLLLVSLALLALTPVASAGNWVDELREQLGDLNGTCYGYPVGWEGYVRYCVHPDDPHCLVERSFYNIGEEWHDCYGLP